MLEVNLLKNLIHPNIVAYKESFLLPGSLIMIMEYCDGKSTLIPLKPVSSWRPGIPHQENHPRTRHFHREGDCELAHLDR